MPGSRSDRVGRAAPAPRRRVSGRAVLVAAVYLGALGWLLGKAALFRSLVPPGIPPDEPAHVSYAASVGFAGPLVLRYESARLLDDAGRPGPLPNYLPHPALYYLVTGAIERAAPGGGPLPLEARTLRLRTASLLLFAAAATLFLWLGWRRPAPVAGHVAWAVAIAAVPPFGFLGAAVNNDTLAFLAGGVALLGLMRRLEGRADALAGGLVGGGVALALLSKATAGLLVVLTVAFALLLARRTAPIENGRGFFAALLPGLLLPALHYIPVLARYGTPLPTLATLRPEEFARSAFLAPPGTELLPFAEWVWKAVKLFASTGLSLVGHKAVPIGPAWALAGPALLLGLAAWGVLGTVRADRDDDAPGRTLVLSAGAAALVVFLLNLGWSRSGYLETGRLGGLHVRYFLPLLPALALAAARGIRRVPARTCVALALAVLLLAADADVTRRFLAELAR